MDPQIDALIARHGLTPLPVEGTLFAETWRSPAGTAIVALYAPERGSLSRFHRLTVDEVWHFYDGDPLRLILLYPDGTSREVWLGPGHTVQTTVPAGVWQAGETAPGGRWSLFGCTCAPAFTPERFEGGTRAALLTGWPDRATDIERLACPDDDIRMPTLG